MGTITDKLNKLAETKSAIKTAIVNKGVSISDTDTFASYADKIASISGGGPTEGIYGVFIYDTNGNLTKPEEWNTANNDLAVGVAVIDENCAFVIGKTQNYSEIAWSNTLKGTAVSGIVTTSDTNTALLDYAGEANSSIVAESSSITDEMSQELSVAFPMLSATLTTTSSILLECLATLPITCCSVSIK